MTQEKGAPGPAGEDQPVPPGDSQGPAKKRRRRRGIQVDAYGIKADLRPVETGERPPKSWRQVRKDVNATLMSITVDAVRGIHDLILGTRKFIRGLAEIPAAVARRVDRAHDLADRKEGIRQEKFEAKQLPAPDTSKVVEQLEALFEELRAEGALVEPHDLGDGRTGILLVPPEVRDAAAQLARAALPAPAAAGPSGLRIETILPGRIARVLIAAGLHTAADLESRTAAELLALDGFGERSLIKVRATLKHLGLELRAVGVVATLTAQAGAAVASFAAVVTQPPTVRPAQVNPSLQSGQVTVEPVLPPPSQPQEPGG